MTSTTSGKIHLPWAQRMRELRKRKVADAAIVNELLKYAVAEERRINREMRLSVKRAAVESRVELKKLKRFASEVASIGRV